MQCVEMLLNIILLLKLGTKSVIHIFLLFNSFSGFSIGLVHGTSDQWPLDSMINVTWCGNVSFSMTGVDRGS